MKIRLKETKEKFRIVELMPGTVFQIATPEEHCNYYIATNEMSYVNLADGDLLEIDHYNEDTEVYIVNAELTVIP